MITGSENLRLTLRLASTSSPAGPSTQAWLAVHAAPESRDVHAEMMAGLEDLVSRAQADGSVRDDIEPAEILSLVSLVMGTRPSDRDPVGQARSDRAVMLVLDGLRPRTPPAA